MNEIIDSDLVGEVTKIIQAWSAADQRIREMLHGWEQISARSGIEIGAYREIGKLGWNYPSYAIIGRQGEADEMNNEELGREIHGDYMRGACHAALSE